MDLSHNAVFWILSGENNGLYRVIANFPLREYVVVARIGEPPFIQDVKSLGANASIDKTAKNSSKKAKKSRPLVGRPISLPHAELKYYLAKKELHFGEIKLPSVYFEKFDAPPETATKKQKNRYLANKSLYDKRVEAMALFLNLDKLWHCLANNGKLADLMALAVEPKRESAKKVDLSAQSLIDVPSAQENYKVRSEKKTKIINGSNEGQPLKNVSRSLVYKCWSLLCLYGFDESSLRIRYDACGAPGVLRPCDPDGRKKAGAKTERQRQIIISGEPNPPPEQPGVSTEWRVLVMLADNRIKSPKPRWKRRCRMIVYYAFIREFQDDNGALVPVQPKQGTYPNNSQIKRIITIETPKIEQIRVAADRKLTSRTD